MGCGTQFCKCVLFSFNFIFAICSLALFVLAAMAQYSISPYYNIDNSNGEQFDPTYSLPNKLWIIIGISGIAFLLALLGCLGAIRGSKCLMYCFNFIVAVMITVEVVIIGGAYTLQQPALEEIQNNVNASLPLYLNVSEVTLFWDKMQTDFKCCGVKEPTDWHNVYLNTTLPASCCPGVKVGEAPCDPTEDPTMVSENGCMDIVLQYLKEQNIAIYAVALTIEVIKVTVGIVCLCLCCMWGGRRLALFS